MPRMPIGDRAMTAAERQRCWRERLRQQRGPAPTVQSLKAQLSRARREIATLRRRLAAVKAVLEGGDNGSDPHATTPAGR